MNTIEQWQKNEFTFQGPTTGNPFVDVDFLAILQHENERRTVRGFYDGDGTYIFRFMADVVGTWSYTTQSNVAQLDHQQGHFEVVAATGNNHGPVRVYNRTSFHYADGTPYMPIGTTAYAWAFQPESVQEETLNTLKENHFNKVRMTVFPKFYNYNTAEPQSYPYVGTQKPSNHPFTFDDWKVTPDQIHFDFEKFNPKYFQHLEERIAQLDQLGIQADLILFHPYDHWGFARMGHDANMRYIKYIVARLASYKNVWWSLANEYDLMAMYDQIQLGEWDEIGQMVHQEDPSSHLLSIHNFYDVPRHQLNTSNWYDYSKPWITHLSLQNYSLYMAVQWQNDYQKPVIFDECRYEGNIEMGWGDMSAEDLVDSFWKLMAHGAYATHGETYLDHPNTDRPIWWAHGGQLHGESYKRINFLADVFAKYQLSDVEPIGIQTADWELYAGQSRDQSHVVIYFGTSQPRFENLPFLASGKQYTAQLVNTWDMTITPFEPVLDQSKWFEMPAGKYQALLLTEKGGDRHGSEGE